MRSHLLLLSAGLFLVGSAAGLHAQATVESAAGAAAAATATAPARNLGKSINGLGDAVHRALDGKGDPAAAGNSSAPQKETVRPTTTRGAGLPAPNASTVLEDPLEIREGMTSEEVLRRFGPPNLRITDGPDTSSLLYSGKEGRVRVLIENGKVSSVEKPKS
jgi:hypothetical protein